MGKGGLRKQSGSPRGPLGTGHIVLVGIRSALAGLLEAAH